VRTKVRTIGSPDGCTGLLGSCPSISRYYLLDSQILDTYQVVKRVAIQARAGTFERLPARYTLSRGTREAQPDFQGVHERSSLTGSSPMRGLVRGLSVACAVLLVVGSCQGSAAPQTAGIPAAGAVSPEATITPAVPTNSPSVAIESPGCDPIDQLFAGMFVGLSQAALSNAGIQPKEFFAALATDRETLTKYLKALGIPADDAQIDAAMSANLGQLLLKQSLEAGDSAQTGGTWVVCP
jgi:hypothetical protein